MFAVKNTQNRQQLPNAVICMRSTYMKASLYQRALEVESKLSYTTFIGLVVDNVKRPLVGSLNNLIPLDVRNYYFPLTLSKKKRRLDKGNA